MVYFSVLRGSGLQKFKFSPIAFLICALGFSLSIALYFQTRQIEGNILQERFNATATNYFLTISNGFLSADDHVMHFTQSLENELLMEKDRGLSVTGFKFLSQILPWGESGVRATAWAPLLVQSELDKFEKETSHMYPHDYKLLTSAHTEDISSHSGFGAAPIQFSRIDYSTDMLLGLDLAKLPEFLQAFKLSILRHAPSSILHSGESDDGESAISIIHPIPSKLKLDDKLDSMPLDQQYIGFAIAEWNIKTLLESTLTHLPPKGIHIQLWDQHGKESELVCEHTSRLGEAITPALFVEKAFHFIDRNLVFRFTASPAYVQAYSVHYSLYVLFIAILLTIISMLIFAYSAKRRFEEECYNKLSTAIQQIGQAIIITDKNGIIEYANPSFLSMTGYSEDEVLGQNPRIINSAKQSPEFYENMWKTILGGDIWRGSVIEKRKDGTRYPASLTISPIFDKNNDVTHFIGIHDDLTTQKDLETQLHQAQKMEAVGTLISGVAHNFNNILAGIMGSAYLGKQETTSKETLTYLTRIETLGESAADMISQLLLFSQDSYTKMSNLPFDVLMKETMKTARFAVTEDIIVHTDICDKPLLVHGNTSHLQQILMSLISNAHDALPEKGHREIKVSVYGSICDECQYKKKCKENMDKVAVLTVEDSGCGIDLEVLPNIFEPFYTTKTVGAGTGLGLSTLYGTIQSHGGAIHVNSSINVGTIFKVCLPIIHTENKPETVIETKVHTAKSEKGILVVDDEKVIRTMLDSILTSLGYKVYLAKDGQQGIDLFLQHQDHIALLVSDVVMPVMGGYAVAQAIREENPNMPIIFITGHDGETSNKPVPEDDQTKRMQKPFNAPELSKLIAELIARK